MCLGQYLQIGLFLLFVYAGTGLMWSLGGSGPVSETENRKLAQMPQWSGRSVWSGQYLHEVENYVADHVPYRDALVGVSKTIASWQGISGTDNAVIVASGSDNMAQATTTASSEEAAASQAAASPREESASMPGPDNVPPAASAPPSPAPSLEPKAPRKPDEASHVAGKVLIADHRAVNLFSYVALAGKLYTDTINRLWDDVAGQLGPDVSVSVLIAPTGAQFLQSEQLKKLSASQQEAIADVYGQLKPGITTVDALSLLQNHAEEDLYFRTDHHWTATGAYYGYAAYMKAAGQSPVPLETYAKEEVPGFLGSLYSATLSKKLEKHPDTIVVYKPFVKHDYTVHYAGPLKMDLLDMNHARKKNKYRIFLSGDRPWGRIATDVNNGKRLAVIKDSYGNALIPFLLPHFSEIYVIDPRQFNKPLIPFLQEHSIRELLFVNNSEVLTDTDFMQLVGAMH